MAFEIVQEVLPAFRDVSVLGVLSGDSGVNSKMRVKVFCVSECTQKDGLDASIDVLVGDGTGIMVLRATTVVGGLRAMKNVMCEKAYEFLFSSCFTIIETPASSFKRVFEVCASLDVHVLETGEYSSWSFYWTDFVDLKQLVPFWSWMQGEREDGDFVDRVNVLGFVVHVGAVVSMTGKEPPFKEQMVSIRNTDGRELDVLLEDSQIGLVEMPSLDVGGPAICAVIDGDVGHRKGKMFVQSKFLMINPKNLHAVASFFPDGFKFEPAWFGSNRSGIHVVSEVNLCDLLEHTVMGHPGDRYMVEVNASIRRFYPGGFVCESDAGGIVGAVVSLRCDGNPCSAYILQDDLIRLLMDNGCVGSVELADVFRGQLGRNVCDIVEGLASHQVWTFILELILYSDGSNLLLIRRGWHQISQGKKRSVSLTALESSVVKK